MLDSLGRVLEPTEPACPNSLSRLLEPAEPAWAGSVAGQFLG